MAALPSGDRTLLWARLMRRWSAERLPCPFLKADLQAAVDAADAWIDSNQTSYNNALPVAVRNNATLSQKTVLFALVALKRAGIDLWG